MFFLFGGLLGLISGLIAGGRIANLATIRFRWPLVVVAALIIKDAAFLSPLAITSYVPAIYLASLIALLAWTIWHANRLPAMWAVAVGIALNVLVVAANGGHMVVTRELALKGPKSVQGLLDRGVLGQYAIAGPTTHLNWLGDWMAIPGPLGRAFPQAYSPGDFLMFAGMILLLFLATREPPRRAVEDPITTP